MDTDQEASAEGPEGAGWVAAQRVVPVYRVREGTRTVPLSLDP